VIIEGVHSRAYAEGDEPNFRAWPFTLAPVAQLMRDGLRFARPVTFIVGENGSGKSTIIEAIAEAYGVDARGGHIGRPYASPEERGVLGQSIHLRRTKVGSTLVGKKPRGYFLRAETSYGFFEYVSGTPAYGGHDLLRLSHGESFLAVFDTRFSRHGLYLMDEPESALSFTSCLKLLALLADIAERGSQVICATHSPLLASLPGAQILEVGDHGIREVAWSDLELVDHWRRFLSRPDAYLRHLTDDNPE
jgi:predicted ATPase